MKPKTGQYYFGYHAKRIIILIDATDRYKVWNVKNLAAWGHIIYTARLGDDTGWKLISKRVAYKLKQFYT